MARPHPEAVWAVSTALRSLQEMGLVRRVPEGTHAMLDLGDEVAQDDSIWERVPQQHGYFGTRKEFRDFLRLGLSQCAALG